MRIVTFFIAIVFSFHSNGQHNNLLVKEYTTRSGLCSNEITCVFKDSRNLMWIGSRNGLTVFDGRYFKKINKLGKDGLTNLTIMSLGEDGNGNIWIGTEFGFNIFNYSTNNFEKIIKISSKSENLSTIFSIKRIKNGCMVLSDDNGIIIYNPKLKTYTYHKLSVYNTDTRKNKFVLDIDEDSKGNLWLATSWGIKKYDTKTNSYITYAQPDFLNNYFNPQNAVYTVYVQNDSSIWAGTNYGFLLHFNFYKDKFDIIKITGEYPLQCEIEDIVTSNKGLHILTNYGLYKMNVDTINNIAISNLVYTQEKYYFKNFELWNGTFFLASNCGLIEIKNTENAFKQIKIADAAKQPIFHFIKKDSSNYLCNVTGKMYLYNTVTGIVQNYKIPRLGTKIISSINNYIQDSTGYWVVSQEGFGYFNVLKNYFLDYTSLIGDNLTDRRTFHLTKDAQGNLWFVNFRNGVFKFSIKEKKIASLLRDTTVKDHLYGHSVSDIKFDGENIWAIGKGQLYKIHPKTLVYSIFNISYDSTIGFNDVKPIFIIVTQEKKIVVVGKKVVYELKNGKLIKLQPINDFFDFRIENITYKSDNEIYLETNVGIYKTSIKFEKLDLIISTDNPIIANYNEVNFDKPNKLLFASIGKIVEFTYTSSSSKKNQYIPIVTQLKIADKIIILPRTNIYTCSYNSPIEIEIMSGVFLENENARILYKWKNEDRWTELTTSNILRYEQLAWGKHLLQIKTSNTQSIDGEIIEIQFNVNPPTYLRWWFILLVVGLLLAIFYTIYRYRLRKALEIEKLRLRIASDLHDDIGATLSSVAMYADVLKSKIMYDYPEHAKILEKMNLNSREMVANMSDIVWAINPKNDTGEKLLERMENYAKENCSLKEIKLEWYADKNINELNLPIEVRKNIYLIFKEFLNNTLKYANASVIKIVITYKLKMLDLHISDNGIGFNLEQKHFGNGLQFMRQRAKELDADISISSKINVGTQLRMLLKCI